MPNKSHYSCSRLFEKNRAYADVHCQQPELELDSLVDDQYVVVLPIEIHNTPRVLVWIVKARNSAQRGVLRCPSSRPGAAILRHSRIRTRSDRNNGLSSRASTSGLELRPAVLGKF